MQNPIKQLVTIGLTENEAKVYWCMLKKQQFTASEISQCANVNRSKIYSVLGKLTHKGFCIEKPGKVRKFEAIDPKKDEQQIGSKSRNNEAEAELKINVLKRKKKWDQLATLMTTFPVSRIITALDVLKESGWVPEEQTEKSLLEKLYSYRANVGEIPDAPPEPDVVVGPVIGKWITEGQDSEYTNKSVDELKGLFNDLDPRLAVRALSALSRQGKLDESDIESARSHPNWLVRIASLVLCDIAPEFVFSDAPVKREGGELWIDELAPAILDASQYRSYSFDLNHEKLVVLQNLLAKSTKMNPSRKACGQIIADLAKYEIEDDIITETIEKIEKEIEDDAVDTQEIS